MPILGQQTKQVHDLDMKAMENQDELKDTAMKRLKEKDEEGIIDVNARMQKMMHQIQSHLLVQGLNFCQASICIVLVHIINFFGVVASYKGSLKEHGSYQQYKVERENILR